MRVLAAVEVGGVGCARHLRADHWHRYCHHHDFNSDIIAIMMITCMAVIDMAIVIIMMILYITVIVIVTFMMISCMSVIIICIITYLEPADCHQAAGTEKGTV